MHIVIQNYLINGKNSTYINETIYPSIEAVIEEVAGGHLDDIVQIIYVDVATGVSRDDTRKVALEVWRIFDANNQFAWKEMRDWLESFNLDCEHLTGETQDIRHFYGR